MALGDMSPDFGQCGKTAITMSAPVVLFCRMAELVFSKSALAFSAETALRTMENGSARVHPHVHAQVGSLSCPVVTGGALEWRLFQVELRVFCDLSGLSCAVVAIGALERSCAFFGAILAFGRSVTWL